jgi:hypothetical protein
MKGEDIQKKLARSLDRANAKETKNTAPRTPPAPLPPEKKCKKISISLFETDLQRIKQIRAYIMTQRDEAISTSQVIKLALRTAPLSPALCDALDAAAAEDGRKW